MSISVERRDSNSESESLPRPPTAPPTNPTESPTRNCDSIEHTRTRLIRSNCDHPKPTIGLRRIDDRNGNRRPTCCTSLGPRAEFPSRRSSRRSNANPSPSNPSRRHQPDRGPSPPHPTPPNSNANTLAVGSRKITRSTFATTNRPRNSANRRSTNPHDEITKTTQPSPERRFVNMEAPREELTICSTVMTKLHGPYQTSLQQRIISKRVIRPHQSIPKIFLDTLDSDSAELSKTASQNPSRRSRHLIRDSDDPARSRC